MIYDNIRAEAKRKVTRSDKWNVPYTWLTGRLASGKTMHQVTNYCE